jgi:hypothetical protein
MVVFLNATCSIFNSPECIKTPVHSIPKYTLMHSIAVRKFDTARVGFKSILLHILTRNQNNFKLKIVHSRRYESKKKRLGNNYIDTLDFTK